MKLSKTKKIILLGTSIGILTVSVVTPFVILKDDTKDKKIILNDVQKVIKILREKTQNKKIIELEHDAKGKIIADNEEKIVTKIKKLIGEDNLKQVKIDVLMENDKEISTTSQKIMVQFSKAKNVEKISNLLVRRKYNSNELDIQSVKNALKSLSIKEVNVYTEGAIDKKITTNKEEILKSIKKLNNFSKIDLKGVNIVVKDSNELLPTNENSGVPITLILSKTGASNFELSGFSAKQMSNLAIEKIKNDIELVKVSLNNLVLKEVEVYVPSFDKKIRTNKEEILKSITRLNGFSNIDLKGVTIDVKNSDDLLPSNETSTVPITLILSKTGAPNVELLGFSAKQMPNIEMVKIALESLSIKEVNVYTEGAIDKKITTNKEEILKSIKKLNGFSSIDLNGINIEVKNSDDLLPLNNNSSIPITLVLSKTGVSNLEISGFSAKQMSDIEMVKTALESLNNKELIVFTKESLTKKITNNKREILNAIKILNSNFSNIDLKGVTIDVKNSSKLLPTSENPSVPIILVLSKRGFSNLEVLGFSAKRMSIREEGEKLTQDLESVKTALKSLSIKEVNVYTEGAVDKKITTNKKEILKAIKRLNGFSNIDLKGVEIEVKNSDDLLPSNEASTIPITLILSKTGVPNVELSGFSAKQMSISQMANFDINQLKNVLENFKHKAIYLTTNYVDRKTSSLTHLDIVKAFKRSRNIIYNENLFNKVQLSVKENFNISSNTIKMGKTITTIIISKTNGSSVEVENFRFYLFSPNAQRAYNVEIPKVVNAFNNLNKKELSIYTRNSIDNKITTNQEKILKAIKNLNGFSDINLTNVNVEILNSESLIPKNNESSIPITILLNFYSYNIFNVKISGFSVKQTSSKQNEIDVLSIKNALELLSNKEIEIYDEKALDKKITTNKETILKSIKNLNGFSNIDSKDVTIEIKDSSTLIDSNVFKAFVIIISKGQFQQEVMGFKIKWINEDIKIIKYFLINDIKDKKIWLEIYGYRNKKLKTITQSKQEILKYLKQKNVFPKQLREVNLKIKNSNENIMSLVHNVEKFKWKKFTIIIEKNGFEEKIENLFEVASY